MSFVSSEENLCEKMVPCRSCFFFAMEAIQIDPDAHTEPCCPTDPNLPQVVCHRLSGRKWPTARAWLWEEAERSFPRKNYQELGGRAGRAWECTERVAGGFRDCGGRPWRMPREGSTGAWGCCMSTLFYYTSGISDPKKDVLRII